VLARDRTVVVSPRAGVELFRPADELIVGVRISRGGGVLRNWMRRGIHHAGAAGSRQPVVPVCEGAVDLSRRNGAAIARGITRLEIAVDLETLDCASLQHGPSRENGVWRSKSRVL